MEPAGLSLALGALLLAGALSSGCGSSTRQAEERARVTGYRGIALAEPGPPVDFTLTRTTGQPFRLRGQADGFVTLLFFGYTNCPDICPAHMANIAAVLADLPYETRHGIRVVFVTTDPERDTPEHLRRWLDRFDPTFIGLMGSLEKVNAIQARLHLPAAVKQSTGTDEYRVGHAAQVLALSPDGRVRVVYPFGTRQTDWAHDLPLLVATYGR
ncbi:MAG: SCO family protein [Gemmatimonadota bacterium]